MSASGVGNLVGSYTAYSRFLDSNALVSNLSPISSSLTASHATGTITGATNATPIVITSASHGLLTGERVKITGVLGNTAANGIWTITVLSTSTFSLQEVTGGDAEGNEDYTGGGTWIAGASTITYTSVPVPTEPRVTRRQILRNTDGQASIYYVDVDTTDLSSTTFSSTKTDDTLDDQTAVAILDADGNPNANRHTVPPNHKTAISHHLGRMFAAGELDYTQGSIQTTFGSTTVTGIGTEWTSSLANRFLYVIGATKPYEISSVDTVNQTLTLSTAYTDATDKFAVYAIRPAPAERRLIYYSEAGLPESWPATNAISLQEDGDEITGLMTKGSFLYILERRHIYRFTFQTNPGIDGFIFLGANRGCINQRCWVVVEDIAYMLDEQGIHAFSGGQESEPISQGIQDLFRGDNERYSICWGPSKFFHAAHDPAQETIRWFVSMEGDYLPRHAIGYNYRQKRWWVEEYARPIGSSVTGRFRNQFKAFLGSEGRKVLLLGEGFLDGPNPQTGTVRGTVTSSSLFSLTDSTATFPTSGLVGNPLVIVSGRGKGQRRVVTAVSGTTVTVNQPWLILPDTTSGYQLGGIQWTWRSGSFTFVGDDREQQRRVEVHFKPVAEDATMDMRVYFDNNEESETWGATYSSDDHVGIAVTEDDSDLVVDLTKTLGVVQQRMDMRREIYIDGPRHMTLELAGVTNQNQISLSHVLIDGVQQ